MLLQANWVKRHAMQHGPISSNHQALAHCDHHRVKHPVHHRVTRVCWAPSPSRRSAYHHRDHAPGLQDP
jgi:hypothetical protein